MRALLTTFSLIVIILASVPTMAALPVGDVLEKGQPLPEGMIDLYSKGEGLFGIFEVAGTRFTLETLRGPQVPDEVRMGDETAPLFEIDLRLIDEKGFPFVVLTGGSSPIDPEWSKPQDAASTGDPKAMAARSAADFSAAFEALSNLERIKVASDFEPELNTIRNLVPLLRRARIRVQLEDEPGSTAAAAGTKACDYRHEVDVYDKSTFFGILGARHSGTVGWALYATGGYRQMWVACNHGTCPGDSAMQALCYYLSAANRCSAYLSAPNCSTSYGFFSGQHVCNDDSYIQYYRIKYDLYPSTSGGTCADSSLRTRFDCF
jgi:hypothetical protein